MVKHDDSAAANDDGARASGPVKTGHLLLGSSVVITVVNVVVVCLVPSAVSAAALDG